MDSNLQLIGSIMIASLFLLGLMSFYGNVVDFSHEKTFELLTQETTASLMEIIEFDFRKMGSRVVFPAFSILDTNRITFLGDITQDGVPDTVRYFTSSTSAAASTPNPNDVILYRIVNGDTTIGSPAGVTDFHVVFLDELGNETANLADVRMLGVSLTVQSRYPYDGEYVSALWEERITPVNLYRSTTTDF